jgi:cathepsin D
VSIGGYTISNQVFAAITNFTNVVEDDMSGLLGLGWQAIATSGAVPLVQGLWNAGALDDPEFGFAFARWNTDPSAVTETKPGGFLTIGGVNTTMFSGQLNYIDVTAETYWLIPLQDIQVGGSSLGISASNVIIDT